jgi:glutaredoxin
MLTVTLYTRKDCRPCDQAKADLESIQGRYPHRLVEIDIDSDPALQKKYLL